MKHLILLRHAKSSWKDPTLDDFDRPLNKRGKLNAPVMGQRLLAINDIPEIIVASPAKRAARTAGLIAAELNYDEDKIIYERRLYEADVKALLAIIYALKDVWQNVMLVGHNPGLTDLTNTLTNCYIDNIVTCGVVAIDLHVDAWHDISLGDAQLQYYDNPKRIP